MESKSFSEGALYNSINSANLSAAIAAQTGLTSPTQITTLSSHFLNQAFTEGVYEFNIHLHTTNSYEEDQLALQREISFDKQRAAVLEYVHRADISILIVNGTVSKPVFKFKFSPNEVPQNLLQELLLILKERYRAFGGAFQSGLVIMSTGALEGCAWRLEAHLLEFAHLNKMEPEFLDWIENANFFCDTYTGHLLDLCNLG